MGENIADKNSRLHKYWEQLQIAFKRLEPYLKEFEPIKDEDEKKVNMHIDVVKNDFSHIYEIIKKIDDVDDTALISIGECILRIQEMISDLEHGDTSNKDFLFKKLNFIAAYLGTITDVLLKELRLYDLEVANVKADEIINNLNSKNVTLEKMISKNELLSNDLKNKKVNEIFEDDSEKFKTLARRYEVAFYLALAFLFLYFFGWYIEIETAKFKFKFAEQFHGNHTPTFYVQKISLLILSTTLAAFLLKRSFMNRRLADDAYRTAKELDALPRYMEGMPEEMKEKIRFDLAYKYFGNGIHHESYTGGENLMHENIKANTDFIKAVKDLSPKAEAPKEDKAPKDAV